MRDRRPDFTRQTAARTCAQCESRHEQATRDLHAPLLLAHVHGALHKASVSKQTSVSTRSTLANGFGLTNGPVVEKQDSGGARIPFSNRVQFQQLDDCTSWPSPVPDSESRKYRSWHAIRLFDSTLLASVGADISEQLPPAREITRESAREPGLGSSSCRPIHLRQRLGPAPRVQTPRSGCA